MAELCKIACGAGWCASVTFEEKEVTLNKNNKKKTESFGRSGGEDDEGDLNIITDTPLHPHCALLVRRRESFSKKIWPDNVPVAVENLVKAGFICKGEGDGVICFYCGEGLQNWKAGDVPITKHIQVSPTCSYVFLLKGSAFVEKVLNGTDQTTVGEYNINCDTNTKEVTDETFSELFISEADTDEQEHDKSMEEGITNAAISDMMNHKNLMAENTRLRDLHTCKVCLEHYADILFLPCGHLACCAYCAPALASCHICRQQIAGRVKAISVQGTRK